MAQSRNLFSDDHFSVDGTLIEAQGRGVERRRGRTTRHPGYTVSLRIRKHIEEAFVDQDHRTLDLFTVAIQNHEA